MRRFAIMLAVVDAVGLPVALFIGNAFSAVAFSVGLAFAAVVYLRSRRVEGR